MRRNRTGPATTPASGEGPGSSVAMACVGHEREPAATDGARGIGLHVGGQAASAVGDACYAVALPWYVLTGHGRAAAPGTTLAAYDVARAAAMPADGLLCDRLGARRVLLVVDALRAVLIGGLRTRMTPEPRTFVSLSRPA